MLAQAGCEFVSIAAAATHAVVQVEPRPDGRVLGLEERWTNQPRLGLSRYVDGFGNVCRRVTLPVGESTLRYDAVVGVPDSTNPVRPDAAEVAPGDLPDDALVFTLPSRYCPSHDLGDALWGLFGSVQPGWGRVQANCDWVHGSVQFGYGTSTPATPSMWP